MDPRLPHHLEDGTFVVIDGPEGAGAEDQMEKMWLAAHGMGHGTTPLFDRLPVFTYRPAQPEWEAGHYECVVAPALADGRSVFMQGRYTTHVGQAPTVTFVVNPVDPVAEGDVVLVGHDGDVGLGLFDELIRRRLYSGRRERGSRR